MLLKLHKSLSRRFYKNVQASWNSVGNTLFWEQLVRCSLNKHYSFKHLKSSDWKTIENILLVNDILYNQSVNILLTLNTIVIQWITYLSDINDTNLHLYSTLHGQPYNAPPSQSHTDSGRDTAWRTSVRTRATTTNQRRATESFAKGFGHRAMSIIQSITPMRCTIWAKWWYSHIPPRYVEQPAIMHWYPCSRLSASQA